jgi:hypothetical protein
VAAATKTSPATAHRQLRAAKIAPELRKRLEKTSARKSDIQRIAGLPTAEHLACVVEFENAAAANAKLNSTQADKAKQNKACKKTLREFLPPEEASGVIKRLFNLPDEQQVEFKQRIDSALTCGEIELIAKEIKEAAATTSTDEPSPFVLPGNLADRQAAAAKLLDVPFSLVKRAARIREGSPQLYEDVKAGKIEIEEAERLMSSTPDEPSPVVMPPALAAAQALRAFRVWRSMRGSNPKFADAQADFDCIETLLESESVEDLKHTVMETASK